ncbi:hypothetical protein [Streptomyces sp. B21-083]|uniref:hypothetical protein n=1 Tax=Streptomyces sp. B21-083 TaxID=3039410 RepID=UPI002FF03A55
MVFAAFLLPPGMLCLVLALGRYEEWLLGQSAPMRSARHAVARHHLSLVLRTDSRTRPGGNEPEHRWDADAA